MASLRDAPGKVTELTFPQELVALQPCKKKAWKGHRNTVSISLMKLEVKRLLVSQIQFSFLNPEPPTATYISTLVLNFQLFYQCLSCRDFYNIAILHLAYVVVIIKGHLENQIFLSFFNRKDYPLVTHFGAVCPKQDPLPLRSYFKMCNSQIHIYFLHYRPFVLLMRSHTLIST